MYCAGGGRPAFLPVEPTGESGADTWAGSLEDQCDFADLDIPMPVGLPEREGSGPSAKGCGREASDVGRQHVAAEVTGYQPVDLSQGLAT